MRKATLPHTHNGEDTAPSRIVPQCAGVVRDYLSLLVSATPLGALARHVPRQLLGTGCLLPGYGLCQRVTRVSHALC